MAAARLAASRLCMCALGSSGRFGAGQDVSILMWLAPTSNPYSLTLLNDY